MSIPLNVTSTGNVGPAGGGELHNASLVGGSASATAVIRESGSGGTIIAQLAAVTGDTVMMQWECARYTGQLHVTLTGAGASLNLDIG